MADAETGDTDQDLSPEEIRSGLEKVWKKPKLASYTKFTFVTVSECKEKLEKIPPQYQEVPESLMADNPKVKPKKRKSPSNSKEEPTDLATLLQLNSGDNEMANKIDDYLVTKLNRSLDFVSTYTFINTDTNRSCSRDRYGLSVLFWNMSDSVIFPDRNRNGLLLPITIGCICNGGPNTAD